MNQSRPLLEAEEQRIKHAGDVPLRGRSSFTTATGAFMQEEDAVVLMDDQPPNLLGIAVRHGRDLPRLGRRRGRDAGRQANGLAGLDPILGPRAPTRDPPWPWLSAQRRR